MMFSTKGRRASIIIAAVKIEIDTKEEINFKSVHFQNYHATHVGVIRIVVIVIIKDLGGKQDSSNYNKVNVKFRHDEFVSLN